MTDTIDNETGEIVQATSVDVNAAVSLARAEIDMQIATALRYPRKVQLVAAKIMTLATLDEESAEECCYALVFGKKQARNGAQQHDDDNKPVEGPSIRLAEIAVQSWGNCRTYARVVIVDRSEKYVEAEGIFHDLETNAMSMSRVRRAIAGRHGNIYPEHLIITTGNAACAIAKRNAILAGIPRGIYRPAYKRAREIIAGTVATLSVNRDKAVGAFAAYGVKPDQILALFGLDSMMDMRTDHIAQLRALFSSIRSEEVKVEEVFAPLREKHEVVDNPLNDAPADAGKPAQAGAAAEPAKAAAKPDPKPAAAAAKPRAAKTYPLDSMVAEFAQVGTWEALAELDKRAQALNLSGDNHARYNAARMAAAERLDAIDNQEQDRGQADQGEEQETGADAGELSTVDVPAGQVLDEGARDIGRMAVSDERIAADAGQPRGETGQGISTGEAREEPTGSSHDAAVGSPADSLPPGNWSDKDRKWLTNVDKQLAAAESGKAVIDVQQYWLAQLEFKTKPVQDAFTVMVERAKARWRK